MWRRKSLRFVVSFIFGLSVVAALRDELAELMQGITAAYETSDAVAR